MHVHLVPVDPSLTPDQAWEEILAYGARQTYSALDPHTGEPVTHWKTINCSRDRCADRA